MQQSIKCRPLYVDPIAHEVVFRDQKYRRTIQNSFRFVLVSYMYHKGFNLRDILNSRKDIPYETVRNNLFLHSSNTKIINGDLANIICGILGTTIEYLYKIAEQFSSSFSYNSISFANESITFFKGYEEKFGY